MLTAEHDNLTTNSPHARVVANIRKWIDSGTLSAGVPLPSERAISKSLGVHRDTVRRALGHLSGQGWIQRTSPRVWTVAKGESDVEHSSILSQSMVVLCPSLDGVFPGHLRTGWAEFVVQSAVAAIRRQNRYAVSINTASFQAKEVQRLISERPLGVIAADVIGHLNTFTCIQALHDAGIPTVVYGGSPELSQYDRVGSDHEQGAYESTRWMIAAGRRRIVNVWSLPANAYWHAARQRGYERAMREAGLEPLSPIHFAPTPELFRLSSSDVEAAFRLAVRATGGFLIEHLVCDKPVDAMLMATDRDYFYLAAACRLFNKTPGQDVLFGGYDNYYEDCSERQFEPSAPSITVDKLNEQAGEQMVELLVDRLEGRSPLTPQMRVIPPRVIATKAGK